MLNVRPSIRRALKSKKRMLREQQRAEAAKLAALKAQHYGRIDKPTQLMLSMKYQELLRSGGPLPDFNDTEFSSFSQNGEDGVLHYLYSILGTTNRRAVEICAGDCIENNTTNLIVHHGWKALLCDGNEENIKTGHAFYQSRRDGLKYYPPRMAHTWITRETVNDLIRSHGFAGEIDLFSLDIDGNDYWIWKAIDCIQPRVVVLEFALSGGKDRAWTLPYKSDYVANWQEGYGASLPAFIKLGREKGYRLIGTLREGINAFFLREDVGRDLFPTRTIDELPCVNNFYNGPSVRWVDV